MGLGALDSHAGSERSGVPWGASYATKLHVCICNMLGVLHTQPTHEFPPDASLSSAKALGG